MHNANIKMGGEGSARGFTLIELLVVLVIMGIFVTVGALSLNMLTGHRQVVLVGEQLQRVVLTASQQAILTPEILGLKINAQGYQFYRYTQGKKGFHWQSVMSDKLSHQNVFVTHGLEVRVLNHPKKMIVFSDSGDVTPFTVLLTDKKHAVCYQLSMSDLDELTFKKVVK